MKINITSTSGKSTFAKKLSEATGHPYIQMGQLYWPPNWQEPTDDIFFPKLEQALTQNQTWILDGNYDRTRHIKWKKST